MPVTQCSFTNNNKTVFMRLICKFLMVVGIAGCMSPVYAQPSLSRMKSVIDQEESVQPKGIKMKLVHATQAGVLLEARAGITPAALFGWLDKKLALRQNQDELRDENREVVTGDRYTVKKMHQYYKGIKVEHGVINSTSKNGMIRFMQMEFYSIPDSFKITPVLTEAEALSKAMSFTGASLFEWETNAGIEKPAGELVIIQTYQQEGEVCLAYKFNIHAMQPLYRAWVYVNAATGKVVLDDAIIKHAEAVKASNYNEAADAAYREQHPGQIDNTKNIQGANGIRAVNRVGTAATRTAGIRNIVTDSVAGNLPKPFRLHQGRNGHGIYTLNYEKRPYNPPSGNNDNLAIDFTDDNNDWTAAEYNNADKDHAALDVHYGMQWVSDYYYNVHNRWSWDGNGSPMWCYVHVAENDYNNNTITYKRWFDNAFWNGSSMHFGDGNGSNHGPRAYIDVCGHELSHAITERSCALVYRWESGALNEAFSDIWAACITNYAKTQDPTLTGERVWRYGEKADAVETPASGLRDLQNPLTFNQPSTYGSTNWEPSDYAHCSVPDVSDNDYCGVHTNSGVLSKWFFLITQGEISINTAAYPYVVVGQGFEKTEKIIYLMEQNLTPNADYAVAMEVSYNIAITEYGWGSPEYETIKAAWFAVGVDSNVFNTRNTSVFTTNSFTCIESMDGEVFAGTNYSGLYYYDGSEWNKLDHLTDVRINDIKQDGFRDIWVAQSGRAGQSGGGSSLAGGVNRLKYPFDNANSTLYTVGAQQNVPSRNARGIYVDRTRFEDGTNPKVWMAALAYITSGNTTSGMLGQGLYNTYKEFRPVNEGINIAAGTVGCAAVGGIRNEIWTFVQANNGINQLLRYNAGTNALIGTFDHNSHPTIPSGFNARAIYGDAKNRLWVGLATGGVIVQDERKVWHHLNNPELFPSGTSVNFNAITGDPYGDVYIGTTNGIVFFDHGIGQINRLDDTAFYKRYTKKNGLPSSNITGLSYDPAYFRLNVATDSGIVFWKPLCLGNSCNLHRFYEGKYAQTTGNGNWSNPATWSTGVIPDSSTIVVVTDTITVDIQGKCQSLTVGDNGNIRVNTGQGLTIYEIKDPFIAGEERQRRQR